MESITQWPQEIVVKPMEEILIPISNNNTSCLISKGDDGNENPSFERKMRPHQKAQAVNCPRCNSTNTKFCYYNNYSLSQPRYFCKGCRRYWTEGGSLRNIPVGGGSRKNHKKTSSNSSSSKHRSLVTPQITSSNPTATTTYENHGQDLNLGYDFKTISQLIQVPNFENIDNKSHLSSLELLNGDSNTPYMPTPIHNDYVNMYSEGFSSLPSLGFSLDGIANNSGRVLFPFEDLKQVSTTNDCNRDQQGDSTGYWNGVLGGGSW